MVQRAIDGMAHAGFSEDISPRVCSYLVWGLALLGVLLRLPGMTESLWYDEVYRTRTIFEQFSLHALLFRDCHNFLYNGLVHSWVFLFGDSEVSIRLPSLLMGYAGAIIMQRWIAWKWGRLLSVFVFAWFILSPFHIWYSTEAKNNVMVMLFSVLVFVAYDRLKRNCDRKAAFWAVWASVLGICTDFLLVLPITAAWGVLLADGMRKRNRQILLRLRGVAVLSCLLISPLILSKIGTSSLTFKSYLKLFDAEQFFLFLGNFMLSGNAIFPLQAYTPLKNVQQTLPLIFYCGVFLLAVVACVRGIRWAWKKDGHLLAALLVGPLSVFLVASLYLFLTGRSDFYLERSLGSVVFYFFGPVICAGLLYWSGRTVFAGAGILIGINIIASVLMLSVYSESWTIYKPNPDWRNTAALIANKNLDVRKAIIIGTTPLSALRYYLSSKENEKYKNIQISIWRRDVSRVHYEDFQEIFLVHNLRWDDGMQYVVDVLNNDSRLRMAGRYVLSGVVVYVYKVI